MFKNSVQWRAAAAALLVALPLAAQQPASLATEDAAAIQALVADYARALAECRAEDFADLFVPETGYFASGFRGHMVGRERLVALVESERHCRAPAGATGTQRPGGNAPTVALEVTATGARGTANLGTAEYQDEYTRTADGWHFASRTVIIAAEKAAGLDAEELLAIHELGGAALGDYYEADADGVDRLMTSGVRINVSGTVVSGRAFLSDGSYNDQVYEKLGPGNWRVQSSQNFPAATR